MSSKKRGLGRGLDALLGTGNKGAAPSDPGSPEPAPGDVLRQLAVGLLQPGKYQPRTRMDPGSLEELAESIKSQGIMQPIIVRSVGGGRFEIIAGERRWRAAQLAGLSDELRLTLLVGQYAQAHYLRNRRKDSLTETVRAWRDYAPEFLPLPHPSWRTIGWEAAHPWFGADLLPDLLHQQGVFVVHAPGDAVGDDDRQQAEGFLEREHGEFLRRMGACRRGLTGSVGAAEARRPGWA